MAKNYKKLLGELQHGQTIELDSEFSQYRPIAVARHYETYYILAFEGIDYFYIRSFSLLEKTIEYVKHYKIRLIKCNLDKCPYCHAAHRSLYNKN